ncbi:choice-of-anchor D domain-containing protein [Candidatus Latescibacterota bacterium]
MKNTLTLMLIFAMTLFGGCLTDSGDDNGGDTSMPEVAITPSTGEYGEVFIGQSSFKTFTVHNSGTVDLTISSVSITGADISAFSITIGGGPNTVIPGGTHDIVVQFSPESDGTKSASLSIECNDPDENPLTISLSGYGRIALSAETYMAFHEGARWEYHDTVTDYWYDPPDVSTTEYTTTCTGQETHNGNTYWVIIDSDSDESTYMRIEGNDVYGYDFFWDESEKPALKGLQDTEENLILRFGVPVGTEWGIWSYTAAEEQLSWSFTMTGEYVGTETVMVPAGTYEDCAKIKITTVESYYYSGIVTDSIALISFMWFAPNVGPVRVTEDEIYEGVTLWTYESVLLSYTTGEGLASSEQGMVTELSFLFPEPYREETRTTVHF